MDERKTVKVEASKKRGIIICVIQLMLSVLFLAVLVELNLLPVTYIATVVGIILCIDIIVVLWLVKSSKGKWIGQIVSVFISIVLVFCSGYIVKANNTLDGINNTEIKLENMVVAVLVADSAEDITETMEYTFAIQELVDVDAEEDYYSIMVADIEEQMECTLETVVYANLTEEITALENNEVDAIIYNEAYMAIVEDENPDIMDRIRVIYEYGVEIELEEEIVEE